MNQTSFPKFLPRLSVLLPSIYKEDMSASKGITAYDLPWQKDALQHRLGSSLAKFDVLVSTVTPIWEMHRDRSCS